MNKNLIYNVGDKVPFWKNFAFAFQQLLAIITSTMLVPILADATGVYLSQSAALIGAGVGTIVYLLLTRFKSPVFLGSSFAFIAPLSTAISFGYFGILLGALFASLVYVVLAIIIRFVGSNWINKIMPPLVIGPVVALIGFELSASAISNVTTTSEGYNLFAILVGLLTFFIVVFVSVKGKKHLKMFPFIVGILSGYTIASIMTLIGMWANYTPLQLVDFSVFKKVADFNNWLPNLTFVGLFQEGTSKITSFADIITIFVAFTPIALVSFAEHIADHKNLSSIIDQDLLKNPGLHKTLLGDGLGSLSGAMFGGCPNTTYGESIGCVAISKNASTKTILTASILCIAVAFLYPIIALVESIPTCVIGGVCISLYGFISVSGLRMLKNIDLNEQRNLFVVASILITGIGGLVLKFGSIEVPSIACALIIGIITNLILKEKNNKTTLSENSSLLENDVTLSSDEMSEIENKNDEDEKK